MSATNRSILLEAMAKNWLPNDVGAIGGNLALFEQNTDDYRMIEEEEILEDFRGFEELYGEKEIQNEKGETEIVSGRKAWYIEKATAPNPRTLKELIDAESQDVIDLAREIEATAKGIAHGQKELVGDKTRSEAFKIFLADRIARVQELLDEASREAKAELMGEGETLDETEVKPEPPDSGEGGPPAASRR
ncbi:MAG: hypothetical protein UY92_C0012G0005 [Candidatus Magasanikbacteria bacterium GW2011_GWA2_56_11]|uniref:Uncharacterized protein n=1 Tax=Candidatus Magasanikbacteria bacterium GW2011_GWA2_56_11 TaxID=1619044 RepID=A0A0G1YF99_9BACT|nr:MAG: hypothetical protein UY92_C0012G0005 [Candidatus Magasanikbacteria bacterium GW2011_GWA2_56_11]